MKNLFWRSGVNGSRQITMLMWKILLPRQDLVFWGLVQVVSYGTFPSDTVVTPKAYDSDWTLSVFLFNFSSPSSSSLPSLFSQLPYVHFHCLTPFLHSPLSSVFLQRWAGLKYDNMPHGKKFSLKMLAPTFWVQITCSCLTFMHSVGAGVHVPTQIE